jgi:hypothetical protein
LPILFITYFKVSFLHSSFNDIWILRLWVSSSDIMTLKLTSCLGLSFTNLCSQLEMRFSIISSHFINILLINLLSWRLWNIIHTFKCNFSYWLIIMLLSSLSYFKMISFYLSNQVWWISHTLRSLALYKYIDCFIWITLYSEYSVWAP